MKHKLIKSPLKMKKVFIIYHQYITTLSDSKTTFLFCWCN